MAASLPTLDEIRAAVREELERFVAELQPPVLWSVEEAAQNTGLSEATIRRRIRAGTLKASQEKKGGRVLVDAASFKPKNEAAEVVTLAHMARHRR